MVVDWCQTDTPPCSPWALPHGAPSTVPLTTPRRYFPTHRRRSTPGSPRLSPSGRVLKARDAHRRPVGGSKRTSVTDLLIWRFLQDNWNVFLEHVSITQIQKNNAEIKVRPAWGIQKKKIAPQHGEGAKFVDWLLDGSFCAGRGI